jgi:hypothetical protein
MAYSGNTLYYVGPGVVASASRPTAAQVQAGQASFDGSTYGVVEANITSYTTLAAEIGRMGAVRIDYEGEDESVADGVASTATTMSACLINNAGATTVLNVYDTSPAGTHLFGPLTIEANKERILVFPTPLAAAGGFYFDTPTGAITNAQLIP